MSTFSTNLKVFRAITGATTVNTNSYAICTYIASAYTIVTDGARGYENVITRYFGPSQSIPASFSQTMYPQQSSGAPQGTVTYTLSGGVEFANTQ
jgi:hypothetical protein